MQTTTEPLPPYDFQTWWACVGEWQAVNIALATIAALVIRGFVLGRLPRRPDEGQGRRWLRDVLALLVALVLSLSGVFLGGALALFAHFGISVFMLPAAFAFYLCGLCLPVLALVPALARKEWLRVATAAVPVALSLAMLFIEPNRLEIREETIEIPTLPRGARIKVAHLTDLQCVEVSERDHAAAAAVDRFDPDFVAFTGDLIATGMHPTLVAHVRAWLAGLRSRTTRYVVNGDCDGDFDGLVRDLPGIEYLKDRGVAIDIRGAKLWIAGLDNKRRPPDPALSLRDAPAGATRIFLAHNPEFFAHVWKGGEWHAELGLAGHTHGGQIQLPFYGAPVTLTKIGRRYADGVFGPEQFSPQFQWRVDRFVVCAGLGMEGGFAPRVRLLRPPQVMLLTLVGPEK